MGACDTPPGSLAMLHNAGLFVLNSYRTQGRLKLCGHDRCACLSAGTSFGTPQLVFSNLEKGSAKYVGQ